MKALETHLIKSWRDRFRGPCQLLLYESLASTYFDAKPPKPILPTVGIIGPIAAS
jgi:hypothetical protein